jgi:hypothetical protein
VTYLTIDPDHPAAGVLGQGQQPRASYKMMPPSSPFFTGRETYLDILRLHFSQQLGEIHARRYFLLHGMGGAGKTQICLKFIEQNERL